MNFVNFDNSATTFPKPPSVAAAVQTAFTRYGGNPGRGGHKLSVATSEQVFKTRAAAADMFGAQPQDAVFRFPVYSFEYPYGLISASSFFPSLQIGQLR